MKSELAFSRISAQPASLNSTSGRSKARSGMNVKQSGSFLETRDTVHVLGLSNFRISSIFQLIRQIRLELGVIGLPSRESRFTRRLCYPRQRPFSHLRRKIVNINYHIFLVGNFSFFACHAPHIFSHFPSFSFAL